MNKEEQEKNDYEVWKIERFIIIAGGFVVIYGIIKVIMDWLK